MIQQPGDTCIEASQEVEEVWMGPGWVVSRQRDTSENFEILVLLYIVGPLLYNGSVPGL
jgi:hypothetical protein